MKKFLIIVSILNFIGVLYAQDITNINEYKFDFTLSGILKDSETGESLPFANIIIKGTSKGTTTNIDGYYTLHNIPTDTSTIIASYIGYEKKR